MSQKKGKIVSVSSVSFQWNQNITPTMPSRMSRFPRSGRRAVTVTSCRWPTSLMIRRVRPPLLALVWKESDRHCR